jgi:predicted ATPase
MESALERLHIRNFLSLKKIDWKIKDFNIITGDMGSGKSLCVKLLKFFEDIIRDLLMLPYDQFLHNLDFSNLSLLLAEKFQNRFFLEQDNSKRNKIFTVEYMFSYKKEKVKICIKNDAGNNILFESPFMEELLRGWKESCKKYTEYTEKEGSITPDGFIETKTILYSELLGRFNGHFPISATFIPASRTALAITSTSSDTYLEEYRQLVNVLPRFRSWNHKLTDIILKAKIMLDNGKIFLESDDGRKVPIEKASSGQQEIVYVLMLLEKLGNFRYSYGEDQSVFIEEPSAHLFPLEQKQTIELIAEIFNLLKDRKKSLVRFFITTHSPYILNSMNNILKKGGLIKKYGDQKDRIDAEVDIPHLFVDEVSAYFIDSNGIGKTMIDKEDGYMYSDKIAEISCSIDEVTRQLSELNNELLDEREE